jgi:hypothetical protein
MKEQPILDPVLPYGVPFEGSTFRKVSLLKCVNYNIRDPYQFLELQSDKYTKVVQREDGTDRVVM